MIWATTTYFNPQRYATRLRNFREFRRRLMVPLVAVELAFGRPFELVPGDADILIQLRAGHVMWQKERLLNLALAAVPPDCDYIAWLDGDVVFEDKDWPDKACSALQKSSLIQLFDRLCHLPRHASANSWHEESGPTLTSLVAGLKDGSIPDAAFVRSGASQRWSYTPGHAWAARRDLLEEHGFYDGLILGAGDKAIVNAAFGELAAFASSYWMNERQAEHYLKWGEGFAQSVERNVGCLGGLLYHLWHGEL